MARVLGIDVGEATLGLAVSDPLGVTAQGLPTLGRRGPSRDLAALARVIQDLEVTEIVVGYPKNMDGSVGPAAEGALAFARRLEAAFSLPVRLWDERLTTRAAERMLIDAGVRRRKRREVVDQVAAALILQGYLDSGAHRRREEAG